MFVTPGATPEPGAETGRPVSRSAPSQRSLVTREDFSLRLSRAETSRLQDAPEIIVVCRLAGIVLIRSKRG